MNKLPLSTTLIVEKVYHYTNTPLDKKNGIYVIAKLIEESKLKCYEDLFCIQRSVQKAKESLNDKESFFEFDDSSVSSLKSNMATINRLLDFLYEPLRDMLRPVWSVYWGESCTSLSTICIWINKADMDGGEKVFFKLNSI